MSDYFNSNRPDVTARRAAVSSGAERSKKSCGLFSCFSWVKLPKKSGPQTSGGKLEQALKTDTGVAVAQNSVDPTGEKEEKSAALRRATDCVRVSSASSGEMKEVNEALEHIRTVLGDHVVNKLKECPDPRLKRVFSERFNGGIRERLRKKDHRACLTVALQLGLATGAWSRHTQLGELKLDGWVQNKLYEDYRLGNEGHQPQITTRDMVIPKMTIKDWHDLVRKLSEDQERRPQGIADENEYIHLPNPA